MTFLWRVDVHRFLCDPVRSFQRLYDLGARRVLVTGTGPLGCVPAELATRSRNGQCSAELQQAASLYNPQLLQMLKDLNKKYKSQVFIGANTQQMHNDFVTNPQAYGIYIWFKKILCPKWSLYSFSMFNLVLVRRNFQSIWSLDVAGFITSKVACCGQGPYNGIGLCTVASTLCANRDQYAFWDPFHPSQKANRLIVQQIMTGSTKYMDPMNLSTIMALDSKL